MRLASITLLLPTLAFAAEPKTRTFNFTYEATVTGLKANQSARIWFPAPQTSDDQEIIATQLTTPTKPTAGIEPTLGNKIYYFTAKPDADGTISLSAVYTVKRREVLGETDLAIPGNRAKFLNSDPLAPEDGKHLKLLEGLKLPDDSRGKARAFYALVNGMMHYAKDGTQWGRGDVDWICDNRFGNCTDFHSLFIALARSQKIPARFEIGFGIPSTRGRGEVTGYHCWAKFKPESKGWVPVDISEANKNPKMADYYFGNLTADRVAFSTGRAVRLLPRQDGPPLNFFVYPYVEVEGKPYPAENVKGRFAYEDLPRRGSE